MIHDDLIILHKLRAERSKPSPIQLEIESLIDQLSPSARAIYIEGCKNTQRDMQRVELRQSSTHRSIAVKKSPVSNVVTLEIRAVKGEPRVDSRLIAPGLGIQHKAFMETLRKYSGAFEELGAYSRAFRPLIPREGGH